MPTAPFHDFLNIYVSTDVGAPAKKSYIEGLQTDAIDEFVGKLDLKEEVTAPGLWRGGLPKLCSEYHSQALSALVS